MKRLCLAIVFLLAAPRAQADQPSSGFPVVYGNHLHVEPDGSWKFYWYQITPASGYNGFVHDPVNGDIVRWRWVYDPRPRVVIWRTRS